SAPPSPPAPLIVSGPLESPPVLSSGPPAPAVSGPALLASRQPVPLRATQSPAAPTIPAAAPAPPVNPLHRLYAQAATTYAAIPAYTARLRQREQVNGKDKPEEVMAFRFRKEPWSVYFRWIGPEARGREVVYVRGRYDGKIHTRLAAGDVLLMPAGARFSVAPDSIMARGRSRHPITEAGIGTLVERFGQLLTAAERGDRSHGTLTYLGLQSRPEFTGPVEAVEHMIPPGAEAALPGGGRRLWYFAADSHLPVLISTRDATGHEVEYYCYDQLRYPVSLTDDDFNPDRLWARR
ncbi:MAG TPA: DUF1571 domain-containing protein, partial [Gemmataceae bacterium]|nr:DUF1571 domain-containing protein [Gemmataceae bacterium]